MKTMFYITVPCHNKKKNSPANAILSVGRGTKKSFQALFKGTT